MNLLTLVEKAFAKNKRYVGTTYKLTPKKYLKNPHAMPIEQRYNLAQDKKRGNFNIKQI